MLLKSNEISGKYGISPTVHDQAYSLLPKKQQEKLQEMLSHHMQDPIQRGLFEAGIYTVRDAELPEAEEVKIYWVRGSVSRMSARYPTEDVDLIIITDNMNKTHKRLKEPRKHYSERAKKDLNLSRKGSVVNPVVISSDEFEDFKRDPVKVDMRYAEYTPSSMERIAKLHKDAGFVLYRNNILDDPYADPVSFIEGMMRRYSSNKYEKMRRRKEREFCHNMCFTTGRLCGIDLKKLLNPSEITQDDPAQVQRIIQLRDKFLFDFYADKI